MMLLWLILATGFIGTLMAIWGTQTRGEWSRNIGTVGGLIWLGAVVGAFIQLGIKYGIFFVIGTFILGAVLSRLLPRVY